MDDVRAVMDAVWFRAGGDHGCKRRRDDGSALRSHTPGPHERAGSRERDGPYRRSSRCGDLMAAINPSLADDPAGPSLGALLPARREPHDRRRGHTDALRARRPRRLADDLGADAGRQPGESQIITADQGCYVADHIEGASFVAVPGGDYGLALGDVDVVLDEVEEFLTGPATPMRPTGCWQLSCSRTSWTPPDERSSWGMPAGESCSRP